MTLSDAVAQPPVNISRVTRITETALLADAAQVNTFLPPASPGNPMLEEFYYVDANEATAHFRHQVMANVLFCDSHVARDQRRPGPIVQRLPGANVGRLRAEILVIPGN